MQAESAERDNIDTDTAAAPTAPSRNRQPYPLTMSNITLMPPVMQFDSQREHS
jgi:hypothetical protein